MARCFTKKNSKGKNVLLLDNTSEWTVARDTAMYTVGNVRVAGCVITGDAVDRFAELERSAPRWISVNERLPEKEGDYLCYYPHNGNITIRHCYEGDAEGFAASGFTHWKSLPAPPAE